MLQSRGRTSSRIPGQAPGILQDVQVCNSAQSELPDQNAPQYACQERHASTCCCQTQQIQLCHFIEQISEKGAKVVASNSDPKNTDTEDNFFDDIYGDYTIERVYAKRSINSNASKRGAITEILVHNY